MEYFSRFRGRDRHISIVPMVARKHDAKNLVPYCNSKANERGIDFENGDIVAVVIDVDEKTSSELNDIENLCRESNMDLYLSNRSFECWLILHFGNLTKPYTQDELERILSHHIKCRYIKSEGICKKIDDSNVRSAIERAEKNILDESGRNALCGDLNPSTTVHFLVKRILAMTAPS